MTAFTPPPGASGPWPAPAKLNLFLHVIGRRPDGYHELQTLFQFLDYGDRLYFAPDDGGQIRRLGNVSGISAEHDLSLRAARLLQAHTECRAGVAVYLDKRLPLGAGLGGGSSDAATTLVALNQLWDVNMEINELAALGLALGADVPVFVHGRASIATGVGEILDPVDPPEPWYVVVNPRVSISTAAIFSDTQLTRDTPRQTIADLLAKGGRNDCQAVVCRRFPEVATALNWLTDYAPARLTGTGSCVFAAFERQAEAQAVADRIPRQWKGFVARGRNLSPLHAALG